ncbi:hypothetical protein SPFL3102_01051 [Sporomusaceae bacterium FL31]|nr:hypothetical protein SPFL3101_00340 [Sporomusaceae bacterium FL31]GCE33248.1 hypothetical protein SPFL3102_01051 [Sporomusaceae bacterium]
MTVFNWDQYDIQFIANLALPVRNLTSVIKQDRGARIGQSTVVSQKVHTFNPSTPQIINVLQDVDAGQAFYQRSTRGNVYHLDIFHQRALIDHHLIAAAIKKAVDAYNFQFSVNNLVFAESGSQGVNADYIDIQTGTGGGRITGALRHGKKLSLRRAHENHVHVVVMIQPQHIAFLFFVVLAVEGVILQENIELRRNEEIINMTSQEQANPDLTDYTDQTDSFMQEKGTQHGLSQEAKQHKFVNDSLELTDDFDTIKDVQEFLNKVNTQSKNKLTQELEDNGNGQRTMERLVGMGIVEVNQHSVKLTPYGIELQRYLNSNLLEIEAHLRKSFRIIRPLVKQAGNNKMMKRNYEWKSGYSSCNNHEEYEKNELAVTETIIAAARRMVVEEQQEFAIGCDDLRYLRREKVTKAEICLIIDASASMAGPRIRAAKFLVRHLLLTTPDRIGVVTFQENAAKILVPLTRDYREVESCLRTLKPAGATPLALGLKTCLGYLENTRTHNPLIILITDGIPTMAEHSRDPVADAFAAAQDIKRRGYGFTCIGLKPHHNYLTQLAEYAGGSAYMLEELEKQIMAKAAWDEYRKDAHK